MKLKTVLAVVVVLLLSVFTVKAQNPCDPDDPACPLDSWTYVLVFAALIFVSFRLYRRQKARSI